MKPKRMNLLQQLEYITNGIKKGGCNALEMKLKLDDAIQETKEVTFKYRTKITMNGLNLHMKTYTSYAKSNKAKVIATLQDVQRELSSKKPNDTYMLSLLNQIKETNFFADKLQEKMLLERNTQHNTVIHDVILGV